MNARRRAGRTERRLLGEVAEIDGEKGGVVFRSVLGRPTGEVKFAGREKNLPVNSRPASAGTRSRGRRSGCSEMPVN